jgi:hypothetical protein
MSSRRELVFNRIFAKAAIAASGLLLLSVLGGCVGPAREPVENLSDLSSDETIVVGSVELVPALAKDEQKIQGLGTANFENKIIMIMDENYRVLKSEPVIADYAGRIEAILGKNFFVRSNSKPFYILGGMLYLSVGGREINRVYFPGGLKVTIKPGEKAVYIGALQYHRDEFFNISKMQIVDNYERANTEFKKKFGTKYTLRKALLTQSK